MVSMAKGFVSSRSEPNIESKLISDFMSFANWLIGDFDANENHCVSVTPFRHARTSAVGNFPADLNKIRGKQ
jgi:hypothetical protein